MPDLTTENYYICDTARYHQEVINGHIVVYDRGEWSCTCKGFQFHRSCKHIRGVATNHCGWAQYSHGGEPIKDRQGDMRCPKCLHPCEVIRVAV